MEITEREVRQDFTITWPVIYILAGFVISSLLFAAFVSHSLKYWLFFGGVAGFLVIFVQMCLRGALRDVQKSGKMWKATEAGLRRVYPTGVTETIRWEQIRHMRWVRWNGLIIRWDESKAEHQQRGGAFKEEFRWDELYRTFRAKLRVQQEEARELITMAEHKTGLSYEKLVAS